jgi:hypothetical protein
VARRGYRYGPRRGYGYSRHSLGSEYARRHIEQARQLSEELGGSDEDVKKYFFRLPSQELRPILDAYEQRYGRVAREYAERTLPRWRSREVTMSGDSGRG